MDPRKSIRSRMDLSTKRLIKETPARPKEETIMLGENLKTTPADQNRGGGRTAEGSLGSAMWDLGGSQKRLTGPSGGTKGAVRLPQGDSEQGFLFLPGIFGDPKVLRGLDYGGEKTVQV